MTIRIREYCDADLERCVEIWRLGSEVGHPLLSEADREADAALVRAEDLPRAESLVAEDGERIIGYISLWKSHIGALFVDPAHHRRGVGRRLVDAAAARKGGLTVEVYEHNSGGRRFYRALGFVPTGREPIDDAGRPLAIRRMQRDAPDMPRRLPLES